MKKNKISKISNNTLLSFIHNNIIKLNNSRYFAGLCLIMMNIGAKVVTAEFSPSTKEYFKAFVGKQVIIFTIAWMGTKDIYAALILTAVFVVLSDFALNEESYFCIVPDKYKMLKKAIDTNDDGEVSKEELDNALKVLEKAKKDKKNKHQQEIFQKFDMEKI